LVKYEADLQNLAPAAGVQKPNDHRKVHSQHALWFQVISKELVVIADTTKMDLDVRSIVSTPNSSFMTTLIVLVIYSNPAATRTKKYCCRKGDNPFPLTPTTRSRMVWRHKEKVLVASNTMQITSSKAKDAEARNPKRHLRRKRNTDSQSKHSLAPAVKVSNIHTILHDTTSQSSIAEDGEFGYDCLLGSIVYRKGRCES
jgi:hypothetical protein